VRTSASVLSVITCGILIGQGRGVDQLGRALFITRRMPQSYKPLNPTRACVCAASELAIRFIGNGPVNSFDRFLQLHEFFERVFRVPAPVICFKRLGGQATLRDGFKASSDECLHMLIFLIQ
jgi:hypothetical protein